MRNQNNIKLKFVSVYLFGNDANILIGAPFYKNILHRFVHIINEKTKINYFSLISDINKSFFKLINKITSLLEFIDKYKELYYFI